METKVRQNTTTAKLPAGIIGSGEEAFWNEDDPVDKKWLAENGVAQRYSDLSLKKRNEWAMHYHRDTENDEHYWSRLST